MLKTVLASLLLIFLSVTSSGADVWIVRDDGVGPVKVGMTLTQVDTALHEKLAKDEQDDGACFYVAPRGHGKITFMIENGKLVRVDVDAPGIATATGIQVGDSEARVRNAYGTRVSVSPHKYIDTGHYLTVRSADLRYGIRFETDKGKVTTFYAGTYEAIQYVEGCE